jgi:hypothetical protein
MAAIICNGVCPFPEWMLPFDGKIDGKMKKLSTDTVFLVHRLSLTVALAAPRLSAK